MSKLKVVELFAGVGGFRIGLESAGHKTVWANQWEPKIQAQHAYNCYSKHFKDNFTNINTDINDVDIDNDNVITLDEIAILAKTFERKNNLESQKNITASDKNIQDSAASLEKNSVKKKL